MRTRQQAPPFRRGRVVEIEAVSTTLCRVVVVGPELAAMDVAGPAAGARLLLPPAPDRPVELPVWNGNAYFAEDGSRPPIRTVTPLDQDQSAGRIAFEIVRHDGGLLTPWVDAVGIGGEVAVSGPSRGYQLDPDARSVTLVGDESALPAIRQLVTAVSAPVTVAVIVEVPGSTSEVPLPDREGLRVHWMHASPGTLPGETLLDAIAGVEVGPAAPLWAAGEAAAMQRIRRHLFDARQVPRGAAHVRGYWKHGRGEDDPAPAAAPGP